MKKTKTILSIAVTAGLGIVVALLFIMVLAFHQNVVVAKAQAVTAENDLQKALEAVDSDIIFKIDSVTNSGNDQYTDGALVASEMRYLDINYTIYWLKEVDEDDFAIYCDIYTPDGTLKRNPSTSPEGHTFAFSEIFCSPGDSISDSHGWGQKDKSSYTSGSYTILIWYGEQVVAGRSVFIMPNGRLCRTRRNLLRRKRAQTPLIRVARRCQTAIRVLTATGPVFAAA